MRTPTIECFRASSSFSQPIFNSSKPSSRTSLTLFSTISACQAMGMITKRCAPLHQSEEHESARYPKHLIGPQSALTSGLPLLQHLHPLCAPLCTPGRIHGAAKILDPRTGTVRDKASLRPFARCQMLPCQALPARGQGP